MATILVIEDSPTDQLALGRVLEKEGHVVLNASNGEAGVIMAINQQPDLILMDVVMPGVNGFQATRQLSRLTETASIPVIIITTKDQETDRIWGMRQGACGYLTKPVKAHDLKVSVDAALAASATL